VVKVTGIANQGRTATVLLRGSNKLVLEEAERSLHDALCVIRCLVQKRFLITGGASPETEVGYQLNKWSKTLRVGVVVQLAEATSCVWLVRMHPYGSLCSCGVGAVMLLVSASSSRGEPALRLKWATSSASGARRCGCVLLLLLLVAALRVLMCCFVAHVCSTSPKLAYQLSKQSKMLRMTPSL
jgi:hypothetical protein